MTRGFQGGVFEHLLQILNGRNDGVVFRVGRNGQWRQITGADFLADVLMVSQFLSDFLMANPPSDTLLRCVDGAYASVVVTVAVALRGGRLTFEDLPDAVTLPSVASLPLGRHRFSRRVLPLAPLNSLAGTAGACLVTQADGPVGLDGVAQSAQRFLQIREVHESRAHRGRIRFLCLQTPASLWFHIFWMAAVLENGVCGFPDPASDWETNLRVFRPTLVAAGRADVAMISSLVEQVSSRSRFLWTLEKGVRGLGLLKTPLMREALEDLKSVVLDSTTAELEDEQALARLGLRVLRLKSPGRILRSTPPGPS